MAAYFKEGMTGIPDREGALGGVFKKSGEEENFNSGKTLEVLEICRLAVSLEVENHSGRCEDLLG